MEKRIWEIDFLRGIAILFMIAYHFLFDLKFFGIYEGKIYENVAWEIAPLFIGGLFLILVGISLNLSYNRVKNSLNAQEIMKKYFFRGAKIFLCGIVISIITWIFLKDDYVKFGILHLIGISIIIALPFLRLKWISLISGLVIIVFGIYLSAQTCEGNFLIPYGCAPVGFSSADYYPIFPWFGIVLIGLFFGKIIYPNNESKIKTPCLKSISFLGRHSLIIYLLHQPILLGLITGFLWLFK